MTAKEERTFQTAHPWPLNLILCRRQKAENETHLKVLSRGAKDSKLLVKWAEEALDALETRLGGTPYFGGQKCDPSSFLYYRNFGHSQIISDHHPWMRMSLFTSISSSHQRHPAALWKASVQLSKRKLLCLRYAMHEIGSYFISINLKNVFEIVCTELLQNTWPSAQASEALRKRICCTRPRRSVE